MRRWVLAVIAAVAAVAGIVIVCRLLPFRGPPLRIAEILSAFEKSPQYGGIAIRYPFPQTVFPPEIVAPTFQWDDYGGLADAWLVRIELPDAAGPLCFESPSTQWTPSEEDWDRVKQRSLGKQATVTILGVQRARQDCVVSAGQVAIGTSRDEVGAPIFYREVNLPFLDAVKDPSRIRWRLGVVGSRQQPPIVLENLPVCGNCHSFSKDGATMGLDVDYANDKGSYAILPVAKEMVLKREKIITWSDYRRGDGQQTLGLLSAVSPDGKHVVSTVKDQSVFVATDELAYSQLFFPIRGILAIYNRQTGEIRSLPGADDPQYVQSNASWSPDGKYLVFARSKAYSLKKTPDSKAVLLTKEDCDEFLTEGKQFLFDLYRIPFNDGKGGRAEPLAGASQNGMSNYFAKVSPDGKWIVFCRAKSFMLLQPDSELYLIPSGGGEARRLSCNLPGMNSWHSWSPNGKWLVFSSKTFTPYTQLFLTHIDEHGQSSPPVLLSRFTAPDRAANIPEFVNFRPDAIWTIAVDFLDDYNYARIARTNIVAEDLDAAEAACRKALAINPKSPSALCNLGVVFERRGQLDDAIGCFREAIASDPADVDARVNLGIVLTRQNKLQESLVFYREAVKLKPDRFEARVSLGQNLLKLGQADEAVEHLSAALRLQPRDSTVEYYLGLGRQRQGKLAEAAAHYVHVVKQRPDFAPALVGLASIRSSAREPALRDTEEGMRLAQKACELTQYEDAESLAILAMAYAQSGRRTEAAKTGRQALDAARKTGNEAIIRAIERNFQF